MPMPTRGQKKTGARRINIPAVSVIRNGLGDALRIGFIPLADCAPLLVAEELGLYAKHGLNVLLSREVGWATIKEKLIYQELHGSHALAGMAFSIKLGLQALTCDVLTSFILSANGNAITLSNDLYHRGVRSAADLKKLIRSQGHQQRLTFGVVSLFSSHYFLLRRWLQAGGIHPDRDVRIAVIPPTQMASSLRAGLLDGFCVGEPWNSVAILEGWGWSPATSIDIAPGHPEKVLLMRGDIVARHPEAHAAMIRALHEACLFCDDLKNRPEVIRILTTNRQLKSLAPALRNSLIGPFECGNRRSIDASELILFHRNGTNAPTKEKGEWVLREMRDHGLLPADFTQTGRLVENVFRLDLYEKALAALPKTSRKSTNVLHA